MMVFDRFNNGGYEWGTDVPVNVLTKWVGMARTVMIVILDYKTIFVSLAAAKEGCAQ